MYCDGKKVGAVIRNAAPKNILNHFGVNIKSTIDVHYAIRHKKLHESVEDIVSYGTHPNFLDGHPGSYAYKKKASDPDA